MLSLLLTFLMLVSGLELSYSKDYPQFETYSDALGELTDVVQSLLPLKDLLQNKAENQKLSEEQILMLNQLIRNNSVLQERVRLLDRELIQCNASLFVLEESRSLHAAQIQRLNNEKKLAVENCQLRLQFAQTQASNAAESLRLLKQLQDAQAPQRYRETEIEAYDPLITNCKDDTQFERLEQMNNVLKSEKQVSEEEIQRLKVEIKKLEDSATESDKIITRLSKMEQVATAAVLRLRNEIYEVKELNLKENKNLISKHADETIALHKENFQLKLNNSALQQIISDLNPRVIRQEQINAEIDSTTKICNDRIGKLTDESNLLRKDKVKLIQDNEALDQNNKKLSKENNDLKNGIINLENGFNIFKTEFETKINNVTSRNQELITQVAELQARNDELTKNYDAAIMQENSKADEALKKLQLEFMKYKKSCYKVVYWG